MISTKALLSLQQTSHCDERSPSAAMTGSPAVEYTCQQANPRCINRWIFAGNTFAGVGKLMRTLSAGHSTFRPASAVAICWTH